MTANSKDRGWAIKYIGGVWIYSDTNEIVDHKRHCARCGRIPTSEGHDACLGRIEGVKSACCGHGVDNSYVVK